MKAEIKFIESPDVDIENFSFSSHLPFCVFIEVMIGPSNEAGSESFGFEFCNTEWLNEYLRESHYFEGRYRIVVKELNNKLVVNILQNLIDSIVAESWTEFTSRFSKLGYWEFENYKIETVQNSVSG